MRRFLYIAMIAASSAWAQHQHGGHEAPADTTRAPRKDGHDMGAMEMPHQTEMSSVLIPEVPMQRDASGTEGTEPQHSILIESDLVRWSELKLMLGAQGTLYAVPDDLHLVYGSQPASVEIYLRLSPRRMMM